MLCPCGFHKLEKWFEGSVGTVVREGRESFGSNELSVYISVILFGNEHQEVVLTAERKAVTARNTCQQHVPCVRSSSKRRAGLSHTEASAHTHWNMAQLLLFTSELIVIRRPEPSPLTCTAKRWSVINFVLPGQTLQHFPSTFWGYLQGYCSGQWIFLHSCLVMLQVHNTHSTIPKARRLGCQDSPCEYVLPFETQTTKEKKKKKKYNWKRYVHWLPSYKYSFDSCIF